jgi:hypothetical protein
MGLRRRSRSVCWVSRRCSLRGAALGRVAVGAGWLAVSSLQKSVLLAPVAVVLRMVAVLAGWASAIPRTGGERFDDHPFGVTDCEPATDGDPRCILLRAMTAPRAASPRSSLPVSLTRFIGRGKQLALVAERLRVGRLVTLVGPGGMGKTRLAIEAARAWADANPADVWFVDLSPVTDSLGLERAIAAALDVRDDGKSPAWGERPELPSRWLQSHRDGQLRAGGGDRSGWTARMLTGLPGCTGPGDEPRTTRHRRGIANSKCRRSISNRRPCRCSRTGRVHWRHRFRSMGKTEVARRICEQLDGMPLAIELAAARTRALSLPEINSRLVRPVLRCFRAGHVRHRSGTVRSPRRWIGVTHLLPEKEAALYSRLSVFAGGCTLVAAEKACSGDGISARRRGGPSNTPRRPITGVCWTRTTSRPATECWKPCVRTRLRGWRIRNAGKRRHFEWIGGLASEAGPALTDMPRWSGWTTFRRSGTTSARH